MKQTILVPTDFSENANAALRFALRMAADHEYAIHLVHAYQPLTSNQAPPTFNQEIRQHTAHEAQQELVTMVEQFSQDYPAVTLTYDCLEGSVDAVLQGIAGKSNYQLIIMGTRGASGLKHVFLGSNTYSTVTKSPIPVWAIPEDFERWPVRKAGVLSNFKKSDVNLIQSFMPLVGNQPEITLLHVRESSKLEEEESQMTTWAAQVSKETGISPVNWKMDTSSGRLDSQDGVAACIADLAHKESLDTILVTYTPKTFFKQLFTRNLVKTLAHRIDLPVFFYKE